MKCPYCGSRFAGEPQYCPSCKQPLSRARRAPAEEEARPKRARKTPLQRVLVAACALLSVVILCLLIYRLTFWISSYRVTRLYTRGEYTPTIATVTMDDGRLGHTIVFYGEDGDQIFLPELQKSLSISGGVARTTIADADWFSGDVTELESANVSLSPLLVTENGDRTALPTVAFSVDVPESPLTVISPEKDNLNVVTSLYPLELQVVPGSTVLVNGEDVTDTVDRNGLLSQSVNVYPVGDNTYTIIVRTDRHHETRRDVVIYRENFDIDFELDTTVQHVSSNETMSVTGKVEPGASISVETPYIAESLTIDAQTGKFAFIAQLSTFGDNNVRFRAQMEGKQDAVISMTVEYRPTLAKYSSLAWKMDYAGLRRLYEQWSGQVFKCVGPIIDTMKNGETTYFIMDVGSDGTQELLVLENKSSISTPQLGTSYTAYAHVSGREMYSNQYYPMLTALYVDLTPTE